MPYNYAPQPNVAYNNQPYANQQPYAAYNQPYAIPQPYTPAMTPQQRLYNLEQQYPQYGQTLQPIQQQQPAQAQPQQNEQPNSGIFLTPVKSREAALKINPDYSGDKAWYINETDKEIYAIWFDAFMPGVRKEIYKTIEFDAAEEDQSKPQSVDISKTVSDSMNAFSARLDGFEMTLKSITDKGVDDHGNKSDSGDGVEVHTRKNGRNSGRSNDGGNEQQQ